MKIREELKERLFPKFQERYFKEIECSDGWLELINELDLKITELVPNYEILQIKEKFGGLRYYVFWPPDSDPEKTRQASTLITEAEEKSFKICEFCGKDNAELATNSRGWFKTLCLEHRLTFEAQ